MLLVMLNMYVLTLMYFFCLYIQAKISLCENCIVLLYYRKNRPTELHSCFFNECIFLNEINKIILCLC